MEWISNRINPKECMLRYNIIKHMKSKVRKTSSKQPEINGPLLIGEHLCEWQRNFRLKSWKPEDGGTTFFKSWKKKIYIPPNLYLFFINEVEVKTSSGKGKLREFIISRPFLNKWLGKLFKQKEIIADEGLETQKGNKNK